MLGGESANALLEEPYKHGSGPLDWHQNHLHFALVAGSLFFDSPCRRRCNRSSVCLLPPQKEAPARSSTSSSSFQGVPGRLRTIDRSSLASTLPFTMARLQSALPLRSLPKVSRDQEPLQTSCPPFPPWPVESNTWKLCCLIVCLHLHQAEKATRRSRSLWSVTVLARMLCWSCSSDGSRMHRTRKDMASPWLERCAYSPQWR